jgi:hypothetical protein
MHVNFEPLFYKIGMQRFFLFVESKKKKRVRNQEIINPKLNPIFPTVQYKLHVRSSEIHKPTKVTTRLDESFQLYLPQTPHQNKASILSSSGNYNNIARTK